MLAYGGIHPVVNGASALGLGRCDDRPCFREVVPGRTSWEDTLAALGGHPDIPGRLLSPEKLQLPSFGQLAPAYTIQGNIFFSEIVLYPSEDGKRLAAIYMRRPFGRTITVADILALYDVPACVDYYQRGMLLLHYTAMHVSTRARNNRFSPGAPVDAIVLGDMRDDAPDPCSARHASEDDSALPRAWEGFAFFRVYSHP
jgi:hypothetical protein